MILQTNPYYQRKWDKPLEFLNSEVPEKNLKFKSLTPSEEQKCYQEVSPAQAKYTKARIVFVALALIAITGAIVGSCLLGVSGYTLKDVFITLSVIGGLAFTITFIVVATLMDSEKSRREIKDSVDRNLLMDKLARLNLEDVYTHFKDISLTPAVRAGILMPDQAKELRNIVNGADEFVKGVEKYEKDQENLLQNHAQELKDRWAKLQSKIAENIVASEEEDPT